MITHSAKETRQQNEQLRMGLEATRKGEGWTKFEKSRGRQYGGGVGRGGGVGHHIVFSPVCACWSFHLWRRNMTFLDTEMKEIWRCNMTFLDTEMKELGRSTQHNTHNARSMIRTYPQVCPRCCCR